MSEAHAPRPEADITPDQLLEVGLEHYGAGDRVAAETLFRRAAEACPDEPTALYLLGMVRFECGDANEAAGLFERVVSLRPDHVQAQFTLAGLRQWRGEHAAAAAGYRQVLALQPGHVGGLVGLAHSLQAAGDLAGALAVARAAAAQAPEASETHLALANIQASLGDHAAAAAAFAEAIGLAPQNAAACVGRALSLLQLDQADPALASADAAIAADETLAEAWFARGAALRALLRPGEATEAFQRAIALDPARAETHLCLGLAFVDLERADDAERHLLRALDLDPLSKEAHASLSSVYLRAGRREQARAHAVRALEIDPRLMAAHQNLAGLEEEAGRPEAAEAHRDRAYSERNLTIETSAHPLARVLLLTTTRSGNTPERHLLPPALYTRLFWFIEYASDAQMTELPPFDLVFNGIGDEDLAGPTARNVARFLEVCDKPFFNRPDRIARTCRHMIPQLLGGIDGVVAPATVRLSAAEIAAGGLAEAVRRAGLAPPVLIRPIGSHGGRGLTLAESEAQVAAALPPQTAALDHYVTAFRDFRSPDGLWRKYRTIFVDRRPYPYHLAIAPGWMVHYETAGMEDHPERLAEEMRFLEAPGEAIGPRAMAAIEAIGRRMDLDFCGIDFSILADGSVLVFEANASMLVHPEAVDGRLARKNPYIERILQAFRDMLAGG
ncbi:MAG: tetratricopeptide repeat protein [Caulobacterales bacterium]